MRIAIHLDRARLFRWHLVLIEALRAAGHDAYVSFRDTSEPLPTSLTAILDFDRVRTRAGSDRLSTRMAPDAFAAFGESAPKAEAAELTLDLATSAKVVRLAGRVLRPTFDGSPKDTALFHALFDGRAPQLACADTQEPGIWDIGLPALESPTRLATSFDQAASRLVEGVVRTIARIDAGERAPITDGPNAASKGSSSILRSAGHFASDRTARKFERARDRLVGNAPRWHVAWRTITDASEPPQAGTLDLSTFRILPDGGKRFFADPFVFVHQGVRHVFVEELPDATGTGVISHFTISDDGSASAPRVVLATPHHLSYPFVFQRDGDIWMLPESAAAGGLDLYRAEAFPDRWVKHARLIEGRLHDATLFEHGDRLWIAAGAEAFQSSTWDALALYWSATLAGPWHAHAKNPVVVDARAARPAGPLWRAGGQLYRPAQDCSGGYGGAIAVNRIVTLTPDKFEEVRDGTIAFNPELNLLGPHTICRAGSIEVVDIYARPGALRAAFRASIRASPSRPIKL